MSDADREIVDMMSTLGGSFVQALANAMRYADEGNLQILKNAFPDYWEKYTQTVADEKRRTAKEPHAQQAEGGAS